MQWLENINVKNSSDFEQGFDFAFSVLSRSPASGNEMRAGCNRVILLFSDGGAEYPANAFQYWNDDYQEKNFVSFIQIFKKDLISQTRVVIRAEVWE